MCSAPFIPLERRGLSSVQWAHHPYLALQDEVYPVCSEPLIHPRDEVWSVCSGPLIHITRLKDVSSPSVWRVLQSPRVKFTQCAAEPLIPKR